MSNFFEAGKAAMTSNKDDWETPQALFDELDATHRFTLDPCSTHENAKCERHYTVEENGLAMPWSDETVFCNPPYGRGMKDWMRKCAEESLGGVRIAALCPARTDTAWFWDYVVPYAKVRFIRGRLKYEVDGRPMQSSPFPSMLAFYNLDDDRSVRIPT